MSLIESPCTLRDPQHSNPEHESTYTAPAASGKQPKQLTKTHHRQDSFDDVIYQEFYQVLEEHRQQQEQGDDSSPVTKNMSATATVLQEATPMMFETTGSEDSPASPSAPPLPQKNTRRSSRMLDGMVMKLESHGAATPHDVYLSSEEDASSSADDFSDYDWESGSEFDPVEDDEACEGKLAVVSSPTASSTSSSPAPPRRSHEITARAVSVVFAGKPAIIELTHSKRSNSPSRAKSPTTTTDATSAPVEDKTNENPAPVIVSSASSVMTAESCAVESATATTDEDDSHDDDASSTRRKSNVSSTDARRMSVSSTASSVATRSTVDGAPHTTSTSNKRQSNAMLAAILTKQKPPFLSIDPYANGSTYSLNSSPRRTSTSALSSASAAANMTPSSTVSPLALASASTVATADGSEFATPKTPTAIFKEFSRSFTLSRKRSRPTLAPASAAPQRDSVVLVPSPSAASERAPSIRLGPATPEREHDNDEEQPRPRTAVSASKEQEQRGPGRSASSPSPTPAEKKAGGANSRWSTLNVRRRSMKLAGKIL